MKNLFVVKGDVDISPYVDYINKSGYELDIVYSSNIEQVIFNKQFNQLDNIVEYKYCFYLDNRDEEITLPDQFVEVQNKNIILFNKFIHDRKADYPYTGSIKFWYTTSLDFDIVGKYWSSGMDSLNQYMRSSIPKNLDKRDSTYNFMYWLNQCCINVNFK